MLITPQPGPRQPEISRTPYRKLVLLRTRSIAHTTTPPLTTYQSPPQPALLSVLPQVGRISSPISHYIVCWKLVNFLELHIFWFSLLEFLELNRKQSGISAGINKNQIDFFTCWTRSTICYGGWWSFFCQSLICCGTKSCWITK